MLRSSLLALFVVCPFWVYLRGNMVPVHLNSPLAVLHTSAALDQQIPSSINALEAVIGEQDTTKAAAAKQHGSQYKTDPDSVFDGWMSLKGQDQVMPIEDCAYQLQQLQARVDFLELVVNMLRTPSIDAQIEALPKRGLSSEEKDVLLEMVQNVNLNDTLAPDGK